jgi:phosphotriesterase-related protein
VDAIAERLTAELVDGIGDTGIKPGILGELGTSDPVHPDELKVLRAAGRAHRATGVAICVHLHPTGRQGAPVLDVLEAEGVDPGRVVIGHMDNLIGQRGDTIDEAVEHHLMLAERGCFIAYDTCGNDSYFGECEYSPGYQLPTDEQRVEAILRLLDAGLGAQLLLSHDICKKNQLGRFGGPGYTYLLEVFLDRLRSRGVGSAEIDLMTVDNPKRMLSRT